MLCTLWWGPHWFWIMPFTFMILMFIFAALMVRRAGGWRSYSGNRAGWSPLCWWSSGQDAAGRWRSEKACQILDRRYASGEITKEQYEQMKRDIESNPSQSGLGF